MGKEEDISEIIVLILMSKEENIMEITVFALTSNKVLL